MLYEVRDEDVGLADESTLVFVRREAFLVTFSPSPFMLLISPSESDAERRLIPMALPTRRGPRVVVQMN
jgi:hypothetical protein